VVFALLVALCLLLIASSQTPAVQDVRRGVNFALAPIKEALAEGTRSVTDVVAALGEIDRLRQENRDLADRVDQLEDQIAQLTAVRAENERLSRLLKTRATLDRETVAAEVVTRESSQYERVVTLDRGEEAGIELGDAVLSEGGALAGTVVQVGRSHSTARLVSDTRSLVIGIDAATRATGEVRGRLSAPLAMGNVPATDKVEVGDLVVTAGLNIGREFRSFYPRGLLIGQIVDVLKDPGAIVQTVLVEPAASLEHLETVLVITDYQAPVLPDIEATSPSVGEGGPDEGAFDEVLVDDEAAVPSDEPASGGAEEPTRRPRSRRGVAPTP
jgi:rod shape-determining protein MreC